MHCRPRSNLVESIMQLAKPDPVLPSDSPAGGSGYTREERSGNGAKILDLNPAFRWQGIENINTCQFELTDESGKTST